MATPDRAPAAPRRTRPILTALFRNRRSSYVEYDLYSDSPYLNLSTTIPPPDPSHYSSSSSSSNSSFSSPVISLPSPSSTTITIPPATSPFVHQRPKPLKPRAALDERSPAAALARGHAAGRSSSRPSRRRTNLSALLLRHRHNLHHPHNNNNTNSNHHQHRPRHLEVVGNDTVTSQGVPVVRGRVPRNPEPNTRRRASAAAAEVRFARANLAGVGLEPSSSFTALDQLRRRSSRATISTTSPAPNFCSSSSSSAGYYHGHECSNSFSCLDALEAAEDALIRRAAARGASNTPLVSRLRALRGERAETQRAWITELQDIAAQVDALPVRHCQCVIDLQPLQAGQLAVRLPCLHVFHADCILPWFAKQEHPKCPIDRCPIPKHQIPNLPVWRWGDE